MNDRTSFRLREDVGADRGPVAAGVDAKPVALVTVLARPPLVVAASHARSTLLLGSIASLRDAGQLDEYRAALPAAHREILLSGVAGTWIPIEVAAAHYESCDRLCIPADQQLQNGRSTLDKTRGTIAGTVTRMARETGLTPWGVFPHFQRFWSRAFDGGAVCVAKLGPKEALVEVVGCPLADSLYFRNALRGMILGVTELFCRKAYVSEKAGARPWDSVSYRAQWA